MPLYDVKIVGKIDLSTRELDEAFKTIQAFFGETSRALKIEVAHADSVCVKWGCRRPAAPSYGGPLPLCERHRDDGKG